MTDSLDDELDACETKRIDPQGNSSELEQQQSDPSEKRSENPDGTQANIELESSLSELAQSGGHDDSAGLSEVHGQQEGFDSPVEVGQSGSADSTLFAESALLAESVSEPGTGPTSLRTDSPNTALLAPGEASQVSPGDTLVSVSLIEPEEQNRLEGDVIDGESVELAPAAGPQFSLSAMFVLVAISAILMAAYQWIGFLPTFLIATSLGFVGLSILIVAGFIIRACTDPSVDENPWMVRLEKFNIGLTILTTVLMIASIFGGGAVGANAILKQRAQIHGWEKALGFKHRAVQLIDGESTVQYIEVTEVVAGGEFERAGINKGDVIRAERHRWFMKLDEERGKSVDVTVGAGGSLVGDWDDYIPRQVKLEIPN